MRPTHQWITKMAKLLAILFGFISCATAFAQPKTLVPILEKQIADEYPALETLYKDFHAHPELGFQETRTAAKIAKELRAAGFTVTEKVGGTGVVGVLKNGKG